MLQKGLTRSALVAALASTCLALVPIAAHAEKAPQVYANRTLVGTAPTETLTWGELRLVSGAVGEVRCKNAFEMSLWNKASRGGGAFEGWGTNDCSAPQLEEFFLKVLGKTVTVFAAAELPVEKVVKESLVCSEPAKKASECSKPSEKETRTDTLSAVHRRVQSFPWNVELKNEMREGEEAVVNRIGFPSSGSGTCYPTQLAENEAGEMVTVPASWEVVPAGCIKIDLVAPQIPDEVIFYGSLSALWINGSKNGLYPSQMVFNSESGQLVSSEGEAAETNVVGELRVLGTSGLQLMLAK